MDTNRHERDRVRLGCDKVGQASRLPGTGETPVLLWLRSSLAMCFCGSVENPL